MSRSRDITISSDLLNTFNPIKTIRRYGMLSNFFDKAFSATSLNIIPS